MRSSYDPWADLGQRYPHLHVERCDVSPLNGALVLDHRVVLLDWRLMKAQARSTLSHEIAHLDNGDIDCTGILGDRAETEADHVAAQRLISACQIAEVLRWTRSRAEGAELLEVTPHLLAVRLERLTDDERAYLHHAIRSAEHVA